MSVVSVDLGGKVVGMSSGDGFTVLIPSDPDDFQVDDEYYEEDYDDEEEDDEFIEDEELAVAEFSVIAETYVRQNLQFMQMKADRDGLSNV